MHVPSESVTVVHHGIRSQFHPVPQKEVNKIRTLYRLPDRYIIYVGLVERRKNLVRLIEALEPLWRTGEERPLVLVGAPGKDFDKIMSKVHELNLDQRVILTGYVPDKHLPPLYTGADLLVFPSLYEGFGLPPLEAMSCGTPVLCSNTSSLPEIVSDAAITVDPYDVNMMTDRLKVLLRDVELRTAMAEKGVKRAAQFSWLNSAEKTFGVYERAVGAK
jgi:glycosyltransferase involved in cell wall biosynthesis